MLIEFVRQGMLDLSRVITKTIPLEASSVNDAMAALEQFGESVRTVITP